MESVETIESPGKYLRTIRESQGLSLNEVANVTRIRESVLMALEEDRYVNLPPIYVKSFLGAYAETLGLDPSEVIAILQKNTEKLPFPKSREPRHPSTTEGKKANVRLLIISVLVVLLMAVIGYALFILLR